MLTKLIPGLLLDWAMGDPLWLPHPVRWMGRLISWEEGFLRRHLPRKKEWELLGGGLLTVLVVGLCFLSGWLLLAVLSRVDPFLSWMAEIWLTGQLLAARSLDRESMAVYRPLTQGALAQARDRVGRIVGRDTQALSSHGVARAAVETVAENTSDGVVAPMLFFLVGGVPLGLAYKAINTLDSMVGYQNDRYRWFGYCAAKLDDAANFLPARLSGLMMCIAASVLPEMDGAGAFQVFFRDRKKHKSPNSAHTEAACAGALGIELGGNARYFGVPVSKPTIGTATREIEPRDIPRAVRLMYATQILTAACLLAVQITARIIT